MNPKAKVLLLSTAALAAAIGVAFMAWSQKPAHRTSSNPQSPTSNPPSLPNHPIVGKIIHDGPELPYLKFNYLIKELPHNLAEHDIDALIAFISGPRPQKFQDAEWGSLVNDIEEILTVQTVPSEKVAKALIAIFRDETKIQMQRDYALQHIGGFAIYLIHADGAPNGAPASAGPSPSSIHDPQSTIFNPLLAELKSAATHTTQPWSGTALNLLDGLLRAAEYRNTDVPSFTAADLLACALPLARDPSAPLNARLPALQVLARRDSPAARDLAREILSSPNPGVMLTQSASAVLARLGAADDLPLLQTASTGASRHTAPAIKEAIRSIQSRLQVN